MVAGASVPATTILGRARSMARAGTRWLVPAGILAAYVVPLLGASIGTLQVLMIGFLNAAVVAALVVSLGFTGTYNFSQATFYGLGAYTTAILVTDYGWSFTAAAFAGAILAGVAGLLLALFTARLRGDYFVLVSLGVTIGVAQVMANLPSLTRGREGFFGLPEMSFAGVSFSSLNGSYYLCLGLLTVVYLVVDRLTRSFYGTAMLVVRYDDVAARSLGIAPFTVRATGMVISATLAGLGGAFLVGSVQFIAPTDFSFNPSFLMSLYVIIGGMASLQGAVLVSFMFTFLNREFQSLSEYSLGLIGVIVLVVVFWRGGVFRDLSDVRNARREGDRHARNL